MIKPRATYCHKTDSWTCSRGMITGTGRTVFEALQNMWRRYFGEIK